jgi:ubiquinone/menaquinone biosynthesis C-methylase UbiE
MVDGTRGVAVPVMSGVERAFCQSGAWSSFTERVVLPRVVGQATLSGDVLELGSGAGANAVGVLSRYPAVRLTLTDVDPKMCEAAVERVARFGDRATVVEADATKLQFADESFDGVLSCLMLHHVVDWQQALREIARVLRPGGSFLGYDLTAGRAARLVHAADGSTHRMLHPDELRRELTAVGFADVAVRAALGGLLMRFSASTD